MKTRKVLTIKASMLRPKPKHIKSIYDRMPFGAHKGTQIGKVYLFDPNYIEWALRVTDNFCIEDIHLLQGLKTYATGEASRSVLLAYVGRSIAYESISEKYIPFGLLVNGGVYDFIFSEKAVKYNIEKLERAEVTPTKSKLPKPVSNEIIYFLNLIEFDIWGTQQIKTICREIEKESNYIIVTLDYDNSNGRNKYLPKIKDCKLGFVFSNSLSNSSDSDGSLTFESGSVHTISFENGRILEIE